MREIKFRGWNTIVERMQYFTLEDIEKQKGNIQWHILKIMQYTGLKDNSGKDIYEGDILTFDAAEWNSNQTHPSNWDFPMWAVTWNERDGCWDTGGGTNSECQSFKTVVGNIFEHPELIKK